MNEKQPTDPVAPVEQNGSPVQPVPIEDEGATSAKSAAQANTNATTLSTTLQSVTDRALHFLAHASNGTLGACLVGLSATTYLVLGRVGLVVIGVAGGVVLHATWAGVRHDDRDEETKRVEQERRREAGAELARRVLDWREGKSTDAKPTDGMVYANQQLDFSTFEPETATALQTFTDAVIKDYVHYWYDPVIPHEASFPAACKRVFTAFLLSLTNHLRRKRPADAFLDFVTNASSIIIVFLNELAGALNSSPNHSAEEAVSTYLQLKPDSSLSYMLNTDSQKTKLADAAEDILQAYLVSKAYNFTPVHLFLKEVLAQLVLGYTLDLCSKPEWINDWIVYGLEESETTKEVMEMVDAGVGGGKENAGRMGDPVKAIPAPAQEIKSKKESAERPTLEHKRQTSRAEEAMDEAMREARRLTQLMLEEDERKAKDEQEKRGSSDEDMSDSYTQTGAPTPTSSQSDRDRQNEETAAWSSMESSAVAESPVTSNEDRPTTPTRQQFTSFDQILPSQQPTALLESPRREPTQLTVHNVTISIFDDSNPQERTSLKAKPTTDYLVQIEPSDKNFGGWMIARKYADFEILHEVLRRISVITGVKDFAAAHEELPHWRTNTKAGLRGELERYLTDAVRYQPLAESEGMKRFLEKDQGSQSRSPGVGNKAFGWPTPDAFGKLGGEMMNVLTKAPKQVAGGGKAVFGGVAGLVGGKKPGNAGLSRTSTNASVNGAGHRASNATESMTNGSSRPSQDSLRSMPKPSFDQQRSSNTAANTETRPRPSALQQRPDSELIQSTNSAANDEELSPTASQTNIPMLDGGLEAAISLPPPPSEMPDDFGLSGKQANRKSTETFCSSTTYDTRATTLPDDDDEPPPTPPHPSKKAPAATPDPITERETSVAIELMFAVITELYTLSSAWQIRRTLLAAAKTYLLRPGNPTLRSIRSLLQSSLLDANLSDSGVAAHVYKLRYNSLPTTEELEAWKVEFPERSPEQKEELRVKARRLIVQKGMPAALTSVMGAAASGEALGKVFDCLQDERVARGLVFGLMLQGLRVVTH